MANYEVTVRKTVLIRGRKVKDAFTSVVIVYNAENGHKAMEAARGHGIPILVVKIECLTS